MLSAAALGMAAYGVYSAGLGFAGLFGVYGLEWWADAALILLGALLVLSSAFVRVLMPGGLALAVSALLALQAVSLHNDLHFYGAVLVFPQAVRAVVGAALVALAWAGGEVARKQAANEARAGGD